MNFLYHEPMVHPAMVSHPDPQDICVIGAGDGGIVREVLKHQPNRVVHAELDGGVIDFCRQELPSIHQGCWDNPAVELEIGDGRAYISSQSKAFDVVIMDMTDPFGPATMLYTQEYFSAVKNSLKNDDGLFVMHCESAISRPRCFQQILHTLNQVWPHQQVFYVYIQMYAVLWSIVVSGDTETVSTITAETIKQRLAQRNIGPLQVYTADSHQSMTVTYPFIQTLVDSADQLPVITDAAPTFLDEIDLNQGNAESDEQSTIEIPIQG